MFKYIFYSARAASELAADGLCCVHLATRRGLETGENSAQKGGNSGKKVGTTEERAIVDLVVCLLLLMLLDGQESGSDPGIRHQKSPRINNPPHNQALLPLGLCPS